MRTKTFAHAAVASALCVSLFGCDTDSDAVSRLPVMGDVTFDKTEVHAGDTIKATLSLKDPGDYTKTTYSYSSTPKTFKAGTFDCGSSQDKVSFDIAIEEEADTLFDNTDNESLQVTVTVTAQRVTSYVGNQLYLDPSSIGKKTQTFTLLKRK